MNLIQKTIQRNLKAQNVFLYCRFNLRKRFDDVISFKQNFSMEENATGLDSKIEFS